MLGQKGIPARGGGVERHVEELATRLAKKGHEVFVYCRANYTRYSHKRYKGVHRIYLPTIPTKHLDAIIHTFIATMHVLFQRADVIHYHSIGPASLLWIPRLLKRRTKIIFTFHTQCYHHQKWGLVARLYLRLGEAIGCRLAHSVITVSKTLTKYAWVAYQRAAEYIPNGAGEMQSSRGVNKILARFGLVPQEYVIAVSRLVRHKGIHELVQAYQSLATTKKLVIVGSGAYTNLYVKELHALAKENPNIIFVGNQTGEALYALYRNAYLLVHPSHSEGLSIVLLEAMQHRLCVLSSSIPENREVIDGIGYMFRTGSVPDLIQKLQFLLRHPELVRRAGARAHAHVRAAYNWNMITSATHRLYVSTTSENAPLTSWAAEYEHA